MNDKTKKALTFVLAAVAAVLVVFAATKVIAKPVDSTKAVAEGISSVKAKVLVPATEPGVLIPVTVPVTENEVSLEQLFEMIGMVISDWRTIGFLAGLIALVSLLLFALRFRPLNSLLENKGLKWTKVYIAALLGAILTFLTTYQTGADWMQSAIAGLIFGLASVGGHQAITKGNKTKVN